jgi:HAD superfamily hydrolase (TIGR01509 family)
VRYAVVASSGVWRSLVARFVRDEEAVGSNPATPTHENGCESSPICRPPLAVRYRSRVTNTVSVAPVALPRFVSGIVFDCDGLLLDTETCWSRAESSLFADYGFGFGPAEKDLLIGKSLKAACSDMAEYFGRPGYGPELEAELLPRVEAELSLQTNPMPGVCALLERLYDRVPLAVATNSPRAMLAAGLRASGLSDYFTASIAADEVCRSKPDPELYLVAFERLKASAKTGVALEDSATGVAAARAAGAFLITVPSQPDKKLDGDYVTATLDDPTLMNWAESVAWCDVT